MQKKASRYEMDMTSGPILPSIIRFSIPVILSSALQLFYNAADMIVVGRFSGANALAAVGATTTITALLVSLFLGLSVGASVTVAQHYGANRHEDVSQSVHTSIALSLIGGIIISLSGILLARRLLILLNTPPDVLDQATLYMVICFAGMPANLLYNFGSAILRAVGDTRRPLYYLTVSGAVNVVLNLLFVVFFRWDVMGVALATVLSQCLSMLMICRCLMRENNCLRLDLRRLRIHGDKALQIIRIGLPTGIQSSLFAISNSQIQSAINSFGSAAVAGSTAAANIETFVSIPLTAFYQGVMSFTSQNYGARKPERIGRIVWTGAMLVAIVGISASLPTVYFGRNLLRLYVSDPAVIDWGMMRMRFLVTFCFLASLSEVFVAALRGMGNSLFPMFVSLLAVCAFRVVWVATVFAENPAPEVLFFSYPLSWLLACIVQCTSYLIYKRKVEKRMRAEPPLP